MRTLRIAVRSLVRRPSFTAVVIGTLALGLGATAAMFAVVSTVVLKPLSYPEPEALVRVEHPVPGLNPEWIWDLSEAGWWMLREESETLTDLGLYTTTEVGLADEVSAAPVSVGMVTPNLPELIGARPLIGRGFRWEDSEPGAAPVVMLGHELWRARFSSDPGVVGSTVRLEGRPVEVVGVMEASARLPRLRPELWQPLTVSRDREAVNSHWLSSIGRLRPGIEPVRAEAELAGIVSRFPEALPAAYYPGFVERTGFDVRVVPLRDHVVGDVSGTLWVLLGAVGLVLLIGCANVANLFLVRLESSRREHAVRTALGAGWLDVARRTLAESLVLTGAAAGAGLLIAWWGLDLLLRLAPDLPRMDEVVLGWESLALTAAAAVATGLLFSFLSTVRSRVSLDALREGVGMTSPARGRLLRSGLVVGEIALALVVVSGAALMLRTFDNLRSVDPGFDPEGLLTVQLSLPQASYTDEESVAEFYRTLTARAAVLPGAASAAATQSLPLRHSGMGCALIFVDDPEARDRVNDCFASPVRVTPGYFRTMGIAVDGVEPTWADVLARRGGVVVSRPLAQRVWPDGPATGQGIKGNGGEPPFYRVVGVAEPVRAGGLDEPAVHRVYFPMLRLEGTWLWDAPRAMTLVVRSAGPRPLTLAGPVRELIRELDPTVAVGEIRTMDDVVAGSTARTRSVMTLLMIAAGISLLLGVIGLYGVVSYVVEQRRPEIGIRMALGARATAMRRLVVGQAAWLAGLGTALGLAVALATTRALTSQLFEVAPTDALTLGGAAVLLVIVALLAAFIPAERAARVEPMQVLRGE